MSKIGTVTGQISAKHIRKLREDPYIHLDLVETTVSSCTYVVTDDGTWNPANTDDRRVYDADAEEWTGERP